MSNNSADSILLALETQLTAVTQIKQVKVGLDADHDGGYPFCRIFFSGVDSPLEDQASNFTTWRFTAEIIQEMTAKSKRNAELDWIDAIDKAIRRLQTNWQLGIGVDKLVVTPSASKPVQINGGPMRALPLQIAVSTLVPN